MDPFGRPIDSIGGSDRFGGTLRLAPDGRGFQYPVARQWLADREAELLPVPYFHVVYTLPAVIRDIVYQNKVVIDLVFNASAETTLKIAADPKHLGARIGILSVLHTSVIAGPRPNGRQTRRSR